MQRVLCAVLSLFALAAVARADEIRLKDGSKIVGSIVGYEDGSFKVETAYGFAMIRKDSVSEIVTTDPKQPAASKAAPGKPAEDGTPATAKPPVPASVTPPPAILSEAKPQTTPKPLVASEPESQPTPLKSAVYVGTKTQPASTAQPSQQTISPISRQAGPQFAAISAAPAPPRPAAPATNSAPAPLFAPATPASASGTAPAAPVVEAAAVPTPEATLAAAPAALPPALPEPPPVREMVRGNLYINQTYGFEMYRAPDWQPIVAARAALPNAIAALGTSDQSTLLIIGRERAHDTLDAQSAATEKMVQEIYDNYRPMPPTRIMVAGSPAIERRFRGEAEKRDWSVVLVTLERDGDVFTILAMTDANSELDQIQENVIAKAVGSLQFTVPTEPTEPHS